MSYYLIYLVYLVLLKLFVFYILLVRLVRCNIKLNTQDKLNNKIYIIISCFNTNFKQKLYKSLCKNNFNNQKIVQEYKKYRNKLKNQNNIKKGIL